MKKCGICSIIIEIIIIICIFVGIFTYLVLKGKHNYDEQIDTLKNNYQTRITQSVKNFIDQLSYSASTLEHYVDYLGTKYFPLNVFNNITIVNDVPLKNAITALRFSPLVFDSERAFFETYGQQQLYSTYQILNSNQEIESQFAYYMPIWYITPQSGFAYPTQPSVNMLTNSVAQRAFFSKIKSLDDIIISDEVLLAVSSDDNNKGFLIGKFSRNKNNCSYFNANSFDELITNNDKNCINGMSVVTTLASNLIQETIDSNSLINIKNFMISNTHTNNIIYQPSSFSVTDDITHSFNLQLNNSTSWTIVLILNDIQNDNYMLIIYIIIPIIFFLILTTLIVTHILSKNRLNKFEDTVQNINYIMSYVNHEIRDPLNTISGCSYLLASKFKHMIDNRISVDDFNRNIESIISDMYIIIRASKLIEYYIRDILDMQKIEHNKFDINERVVSLGKIAIDLKKSLTYTITEHEINVKYIEDIFDREYMICVDNARLEQILSNYILNAYKFTNKGYVKLSITEDDEHIIFKVEDTGIGITPEIQKQIFNVKYVGRDINMYGLGIGLYLCKQIANLLKCEIGFTVNKQEIDKTSTTFYVKLKKELIKISQDVEMIEYV